MKISIYIVFGLTLAAFIGGVVFGYFNTSEYQASMYEKQNMSLGLADKTFDLRYVNAMIAHHKGAMLLADKAKQYSTRPEIKTLAQSILADEPKAIQELYDFKKDWYRDTKKVKDPQVANLAKADKTFDLRFLNALIAHHEAGIVMTRETRLKSTRPQVLDNADAVEEFLSNGIVTLQKLRSDLYGIK